MTAVHKIIINARGRFIFFRIIAARKTAPAMAMLARPREVIIPERIKIIAIVPYHGLNFLSARVIIPNAAPNVQRRYVE